MRMRRSEAFRILDIAVRPHLAMLLSTHTTLSNFNLGASAPISAIICDWLMVHVLSSHSSLRIQSNFSDLDLRVQYYCCYPRSAKAGDLEISDTIRPTFCLTRKIISMF